MRRTVVVTACVKPKSLQKTLDLRRVYKFWVNIKFIFFTSKVFENKKKKKIVCIYYTQIVKETDNISPRVCVC